MKNDKNILKKYDGFVTKTLLYGNDKFDKMIKVW